jgi:hypothetical protein
VTRFAFPGFVRSQRHDLMTESITYFRLAAMRLTGINRSGASRVARASAVPCGDAQHAAGGQPRDMRTGAGAEVGERVV